MEREGGNGIKVNSVVMKENASKLQHLERHLADILEETAQVERELGYRHNVFEEEIQALRKQRMKIVREKEKTRMLSGKLQEIASLYEKTEQRMKTESENHTSGSGMNNNGGETNQGSDSMSDIYERNQPDAQNQVLDLWDKEFIRKLIEELQKKHWLFSYGLLPEFPPGFPEIHSFADVKFSKAWVSDRVANQQILKTLTTLMK